MQLENTFTVPVPVDEAFRILRDIERIAPCIPGAAITEVNDEEFKGNVKVKVGPVTVSYRGTARFTEIDEANHTARLKASGREGRGSGTANATVTSRLVDKGGETEVTMTTDLAITGKPAQFGRGVMNDVGNKLVNKFADCLAAQLQGDTTAPAAVGTPDGQEAAVPAATTAGGVSGTATPPSSPSPALGDPAVATAGATQGAAAPLGQAQVAAPTPQPAGRPADAPPAAAQGAPASAAQAPGQAQSQAEAEPEALDLLDIAGGSVLKRVGPVVAGIAALLVAVAVLRRRGSAPAARSGGGRTSRGTTRVVRLRRA